MRNVVTSLVVAVLLLAVAARGVFGATASGGETTADSNTVILDHLNGVSLGEARGGLGFVPSMPGMGSAGDFGASKYVVYRADADLETDGTIELWVKPREHDVELLNFNWYYASSRPGAGHVIQLKLDADGKVNLRRWSQPSESCGMPPLTGSSTVPLDAWTHIAVTWNSETRIYVDGVLDASTSLCFSPSARQGTWVYLNPWGQWDVGYVDELHVSKVARTAEEIAARVAQTEPVPALSTLGLVAAAAAFLAAGWLAARRRRRRTAA